MVVLALGKAGTCLPFWAQSSLLNVLRPKEAQGSPKSFSRTWKQASVSLSVNTYGKLGDE